jgi:ATP-dependent helicase/nuclease subunit A
MEKAIVRWSEGAYFPGNTVPEYQILKGQNFLDWICPALIKHEKSKAFREAANITVSPGCMADDPSAWEIEIYNREDIIKDNNILLNDAAAGSEDYGGGKYYDEIKRRLEYKYPYIKSSMIHAKLTVTELKKMFGTVLDDEYTEHIFVPEIIKKPAFLEGEGKLSAAERGTTMHLVMQHVPMDKPPSEEDIKSLLENMTDKDFMTKEEKSAVDIKRIVKFFESPLGLRLLKSKNVKRETPFYMEIDGRDVYKDLDDDAYKGEKVILQGVIDCFFEEDDGLVLIDYKTDYVPDNNTDIIKERYRLQIDYYAKALERLTEKKVKGKYIYLFFNGETIAF